MHIKTGMLTFLVMLMTSGFCFDGHGQSILSVQCPIGLPLPHATGPSQALGGGGTGVMNDFFGMADNPANLGGMTKSSFSAITSLDVLSLDEDGERARFAALSPMLLSFAFPLREAGTFGISIDRRSDVRLKYRARETVRYSTGEIDTVDFGIMKNGGLTSWQAGWGHAIGRWARAGVSYERLYVLSNEITMWRSALGILQGSVPSSILYDTTVITFRGNAFRAGILVPLNNLTIGCTGEYVVSGDAKKVSVKESPDRVDTITDKFTLHLPPSLGLGASYIFSPRWLAAASGSVTLWRNYTSGVSLGLPPQDAWSFGCGGQFVPAPNLLVPRYWEIIQYRAGFRYAQLPTATGSEAAFTVSLGLPFQQGTGLFDIIVEIGRRSDSAYERYSENFLSLKLGLNGGKKWFQNTGIRY
ncbi:MAG: hypothetical protein JXA71_09275 [Chitinispirillaceae bacterium]|nr:hypothetical protein [Chitinispirillaceae bacterium]